MITLSPTRQLEPASMERPRKRDLPKWARLRRVRGQWSRVINGILYQFGTDEEAAVERVLAEYPRIIRQARDKRDAEMCRRLLAEAPEMPGVKKLGLRIVEVRPAAGERNYELIAVDDSGRRQVITYQEAMMLFELPTPAEALALGEAMRLGYVDFSAVYDRKPGSRGEPRWIGPETESQWVARRAAEMEGRE